jgi:hypothetical protein
MHRDWRSLGVRIDPLLKLLELPCWVLRDDPSRGGRAARMNIGQNFLPAHRIAEAAIDPIRLRFVGVDNQVASPDARLRLWPLGLGVFRPSLGRGND